MLDAYIIEKIKEEELNRQRRNEEGRRIQLELPKPWDGPAREKEEDSEDHGRGPIIIPLYPEVEDDAA